MILGITGIITAYILLALLLLSINLYSKYAWQLKALLIVVTSGFYIVTYFSFPPLLGWSTSQALPEKFRLISAYVIQPNAETGKEGAVHLWLAKMNNMKSLAEPRAYKLQYSKGLHEKVITANAKLAKKIPQLGEFKKPDDISIEVDEQKQGMESIYIEFYDLPDPLFPDK